MDLELVVKVSKELELIQSPPLLNLSVDMVYLWCYISVGLFQKLVYTKSALHVRLVQLGCTL